MCSFIKAHTCLAVLIEQWANLNEMQLKNINWH